MRFRRALPALFDFIREACAISLLPPQFFAVGLQKLRNDAYATDIRIAYLLVPFFQYVEDKWLNNVNRREWLSLFDCLHRTNNSCECHNRMLRRAVGAYRPNVYLFIEALARLEHNAFLDTDYMVLGGRVRRARRWQSVFHDRELSGLCETLRNNVFINMEECVGNFLSRASNLFRGAFDHHVANEGNAV